MNKTFTVISLQFLDATNEVKVELQELGTSNRVFFVLPFANPQVAALTIGTQVSGVFTVI